MFIVIGLMHVKLLTKETDKEIETEVMMKRIIEKEEEIEIGIETLMEDQVQAQAQKEEEFKVMKMKMKMRMKINKLYFKEKKIKNLRKKKKLSEEQILIIFEISFFCKSCKDFFKEYKYIVKYLERKNIEFIKF